MRRRRAGAHEPADDAPALDLPLAAGASPHDRWHDWRTDVRAAGAVSALLGLVVLASVAYQLWGTGIVEARAQHDLRQRFNEMLSSTVPPTSRAGTSIGPASVGPPTDAAPGVPSSADAAPLPLAQTTEPPPTLPAPDEPSPHPEIKDGAPVARLEIPAIGVDQVVVSGVLSSDLSHGPGHYPATPLPGEVGNAGIAGHRTTYGSPFADLDKLQRGDGIIVTTTAGRFFFAVTGSKIVEPSDASVLAPTTDVRLTLTTCHPRYSTARRLVVTAVLAPEPRKEPVATTAPAPATPPPPVAPASTAAPATTNAPATTVPVTTVPAPTTSGVTTVTTPVTAAPTTSATTSAPTTVPATTTSAEQQVNDAYL